jgi:ferredoxin
MTEALYISPGSQYYDLLQGGNMIAIVDRDACTGCELCTDICPAVFKMDGDKAIAYTTPVPKAEEANAQDAADQCPVSCISIEKQ